MQQASSFSSGVTTYVVLCIVSVEADQRFLREESEYTPLIVNDNVRSVKPNDQHGTILLRSVVPNWSGAKRDGKARYLETLFFTDSNVENFYGRDAKKIRRVVASMIHGLNMYLHQIEVHMIIVDVMNLVGYNTTLEQFSNFRTEKFAELPEHDIAILIRHGYEGGIAFVNGACGRSAVGVVGFFPEAPMEFASVFFHEIAHLLGLSHDAKADCDCEYYEEENCLKIEGFDNDCSVQALIDLLPTKMCIQSPPETLPKTVLPICGNEVIEPTEECDCGPQRFCNSLVCNAITCKRTISNLQLSLIAATFLMCFIIAISCLSMKKKKRRPQVFCQRSNTISKRIWDTPTFTPLVNSLSDSQTPIWNSSTQGDDSFLRSPFTSPEKPVRPLMSSTPKKPQQWPPLPPRLVNYANINFVRSTEDIAHLHSPVNSNNVSPMNASSCFQTSQCSIRNAKTLAPHRIEPPPPATERSFKSLEALHQVDSPNETSNLSGVPTGSVQEAKRRLNFVDEESQGPSWKQCCPVQTFLLDHEISFPEASDRERQRQELIDALTERILSRPTPDEIENENIPPIRTQPGTFDLESVIAFPEIPVPQLPSTHYYDLPPKVSPLFGKLLSKGMGFQPFNRNFGYDIPVGNVAPLDCQQLPKITKSNGNSLLSTSQRPRNAAPIFSSPLFSKNNR